VNADLLSAIAVTAELTGTELSKGALNVMFDELSAYPVNASLAALTRCRREIKGRLTLADILSRIDDGRPGVEQAWSMIPHDESSSCMWTEEMRGAFGSAYPHLERDDTVAARMAFKESYDKLVLQARGDKTPVKWSFSPGTNKAHREAVLLEAVDRKYITQDRAMRLLPESEAIAKAATAPALENQSKIRELTALIGHKPAQQEQREYSEDEYPELLSGVKLITPRATA
jgi:hypothetical protein